MSHLLDFKLKPRTLSNVKLDAVPTKLSSTSYNFQPPVMFFSCFTLVFTSVDIISHKFLELHLTLSEKKKAVLKSTSLYIVLDKNMNSRINKAQSKKKKKNQKKKKKNPKKKFI